jgi:hypothetical protein
MRRGLLIAAALAFLGACSSGDGGCGAPDKKEDTGQSTGMSGGGGGGGGGLGETVSFQGMGKKQAPPPAQGAAPAQAAAAPAAKTSAPAAGAASGASSSQSVICGGFKDLPSDCFKSPLYPAIKKKCCASGQVERCEAIPGGARLIGKGCTAAP